MSRTPQGRSIRRHAVEYAVSFAAVIAIYLFLASGGASLPGELVAWLFAP